MMGEIAREKKVLLKVECSLLNATVFLVALTQIVPTPPL